MAPKNEVVASLAEIAAAKKKAAASLQRPKKTFEHIKPTLPDSSDEESSSSSDSDSDESIDAGATKDLFSRLNGTSQPFLSKLKSTSAKAQTKNLPSKKTSRSESEVESENEEEEEDTSSEEGTDASADHKAASAARAGKEESDSENDSEVGSDEEEESSSEDEDEAPKRTTQKSSVKGSRVKPESESESESEESEGEGKSSESEVESEHGGEQVEKPKVVKPTNEDVAMVDASSESSESEDESEEAPVRRPKAKISAKTNVKSSAKGPKSSEIVEPGTSDKDEESEDKAEEELDKETARTKSTSDGAAVVPFQLKGSGFQVGPVIDQDTLKIGKMLKEAKASGQQVWYFTAPESIPVTVIQKMAIDMNKAKEGKGFLMHNGDNYTMAGGDASASKEIKLVVADKTLHVDQVYHLEQVRTIFAPKAQPDTAKRTPRPQPKNLKPRCPPIGVSDRNLGKIDPDGTDEDEDEDDEIAHHPPARSSPEAERKAKEPKKSKKRKHAEAQEVAGAAAASEERTAASPAKKPRFENVQSKPVSVVPASVVAKKAAEVDVTPVEPPVFSTQPSFSTQPAVDIPEKAHSATKKKKTSILPSSNAVKQTPILPPVPKINKIARPASTPVPAMSSQKSGSSVVETPTKTSTKQKPKKSSTTDTNAAAEPEAPEPAPRAEPDTPRKSTEATEPEQLRRTKKSRKRAGKNRLTNNVLGDFSERRQVTPVDPPHVPGMPMKK